MKDYKREVWITAIVFTVLSLTTVSASTYCFWHAFALCGADYG
ncbi:MAG: hypothetical protein DDT31_01311 [Syntrophomonadaceae bacterium]|nr:hypothetical protein [Bacillota bacterium]